MKIDISNIFPYLISVMSLTVFMFLVALTISPLSRDADKETPYERGFHPFDDSRKEFNVHFYLIAILFIIFDVEIVLILPRLLGGLSLLSYHNYVNCILALLIFLLFLILGFIYEWVHNVLDW